MKLDPTEIDAALADRANWPMAAKYATLSGSGDRTRRDNVAILVAAIRKRDARIAELEDIIARLTAFGSNESASVPGPVIEMNHTDSVGVASPNAVFEYAPSGLSVGVPSQVVRVEPPPAPDEAFVATPLAPPVNKIATYPRNSPANGVDEQ